MDDETIKETAKAVQAAAPVAGKVIDALTRTGAYVTEVLGSVPHDLIGRLGGDYLHHARLRNAAQLGEETKKILHDRGVTENKTIAPAIAVPLIEAAIDAPDELRTMWARLLANALDPKRGGIRQTFIEALKKFDPQDALVLNAIYTRGAEIRLQDGMRPTPGSFPTAISLSEGEIEISIQHLSDLRCIAPADVAMGPDRYRVIRLTAFGREILRACQP